MCGKGKGGEPTAQVLGEEPLYMHTQHVLQLGSVTVVAGSSQINQTSTGRQQEPTKATGNGRRKGHVQAGRTLQQC